jgi:hypothetical protein
MVALRKNSAKFLEAGPIAAAACALLRIHANYDQAPVLDA